MTAIASDYATYKGKAADYYDGDAQAPERDRINAGLLNATDDVTGYIRLYAVYDLNPDGTPVDEAIATALTRATCAQFDWFENTGDDSGASAIYDSTSVMSVSLSRGTRTGRGSTAAASLVSPRALTILQNAGLLSSTGANEI